MNTKKILLLLAVLAITGSVWAQETPLRSLNTIGTGIAKQEVLATARQISRYFKSAVRSTTRCGSDYNYAWYCSQNMKPGATIEIMHPRTHEKKSYPALEYFERLRNAFCVQKIYARAEFHFTDYPISDTAVTASGLNHTTVRVTINQRFEGFNAANNRVYGDMTIKVIVIDFNNYRGQYYDAKIIRVEAVSARMLDNN